MWVLSLYKWSYPGSNYNNGSTWNHLWWKPIMQLIFDYRDQTENISNFSFSSIQKCLIDFVGQWVVGKMCGVWCWYVYIVTRIIRSSMWVCLICAGGCYFHLSLTTIIKFQFILSLGSAQPASPPSEIFSGVLWRWWWRCVFRGLSSHRAILNRTQKLTMLKVI